MSRTLKVWTYALEELGVSFILILNPSISACQYTPQSLTWNLKMIVSKRIQKDMESKNCFFPNEREPSTNKPPIFGFKMLIQSVGGHFKLQPVNVRGERHCQAQKPMFSGPFWPLSSRPRVPSWLSGDIGLKKATQF